MECRFEVWTAEGEALDVSVSFAGSSTLSLCCDFKMRQFRLPSWSVSVNGVELGTGIVFLPEVLDGGIATVDAAGP